MDIKKYKNNRESRQWRMHINALDKVNFKKKYYLARLSKIFLIIQNFNVLRSEKKYLRNYFLWFAILLLIDNIFIELYKSYQDGLDKQIL